MDVLKGLSPTKAPTAGAGSLTVAQMSERLNQIAPGMKPAQRDDGTWFVADLHASVLIDGVETGLPQSTQTADQAIEEAFNQHTDGQPLVLLPGGVRARWNGDNWTEIAGSLSSLSAHKAKALGEHTVEHRQSTGQIGSKEPVPTIAVVGKYPSTKWSSEASRLIDKGFAMDQAGQPDKAIAQYDSARPALRQEIAKALGDKLTAEGITPEKFVELSATADPMIAGLLADSGLFTQMPKGLQETTLKFFNRMGLANKHDGDPSIAAVYCMTALRLDPSYGPAHYNFGCATLSMENANGPTDVERRSNEALDHLERALESDKAFFSELALNDPDWNAQRDNARFRQLVGLPSLPDQAS